VPTPYNGVTARHNLSCTEQTNLSPAGKVFVQGEIWEVEPNQMVRRGKCEKVVEVAKTLNIR